jgi:threonyl-tRNA synthetase
MGVLLEHYGGAFPVWLAPVQVVLVPISKDQAEYSAAVADRLKASGYRVELTDPAERMQNRIRLAVEQHVPYVLVMGRREAEAGAVSVRSRDAGDLGSMSVEDLQQRLAQELAVATPRRVVDEPISGA